MAKSKSPSTSLGPDTRVLILSGPEEMLKREVFLQLRDALKKAFDSDIDPSLFDGKFVPPAEVFDELRTMSLLQPYRLVVVDDADQFASNYRDMLERYAQEPVEGATLVLRSVKWNKGKLDDYVKKVGAVIKCEPLKPAEAAAWLGKRAESHHQRKLAPASATLMVDRLGAGLMRLDNELAKLALMVGEGDVIPPAIIEQAVGRGSDEKAWVVQEAVLKALLDPSGNGAGKAIETIHELVDLADESDVGVLYFVADLMRKFHLAAMLRRQRVNDFQIATDLKIWGEAKTLFFQVLNRLNPSSTAHLLARAVKMDVRSKSGLGDAVENLECFCATLADEIRVGR